MASMAQSRKVYAPLNKLISIIQYREKNQIWNKRKMALYSNQVFNEPIKGCRQSIAGCNQ
jgi:hypothetical protein